MFPTLSHFLNIRLLLILTALLTVSYSVDPLTKKHHFGFVGRLDRETQFCYKTTFPAYQPGIRECRERLMRYSLATTREIIIDTSFEAMNREAL